jgi:hypothetical protein
MKSGFGTPLLAVLLLGGAAAAAWKFGFVSFDQLIYLGKMVIGWTAWSGLVALGYAGLERLFPKALHAAHDEHS